MPQSDVAVDNRREVHPRTVLFVLTSMFCLVYLDRGSFSSNGINGKRRSTDNPDGDGFQGEFDLSNFEDGLLSSLFMGGTLVGSILFSQAIRYYNPLRLIGLGSLIWAVAVGLGAATIDFYTMGLCRIFVGFGEAAILAIGPTYIDDKAPREKVTLWLAVLYLAIPVGLALGFSAGAAFGSLFSWRSIFPVQALLMLPLVIFCYTVPPVALNLGRDTPPESGGASQIHIFWEDAKVVFSHKVYDITLVGNVFHTGVMGVLSYWGAKAADAMFDREGMDLWIGGALFITGTIGILSGGALVDRLGSGIFTALIVGSSADLIAAATMALGFLFVEEFFVFLLPFFICFTCIYISLAPVAAVSLWSVPLHLRPLATSINTIGIHLLGDLPSPAIFGALLDFMEDGLDRSEGSSYRVGIGIASFFLLVSSGIFFLASRIGKTAKDYRASEEETTEERRPMLSTHPVVADGL